MRRAIFLLLAFAATGCENTIEAIECSTVCDEYKVCYGDQDEDFVAADCKTTCNEAKVDEDIEDELESCIACITDNCGEQPEDCDNACSDVPGIGI